MADDIGSKLGFDASDSIAAIQRLKKELDSYNEALTKIAGGSNAFNAAQGRIDETFKKLSANSSAAIERLKALSTAQAQATLQAEKFTAAQLRAGTVVINRQPTAFQQTLPGGTPQPFGRTLGEADQARQLEQLRATELALRNVARGAKESGEAVAAGSATGAAGAQNLSLSWQSVIRVFGIQFAAQAISAVVNAFQGAIDAGRQFEIRLAEIQTISKEFQASGINSVAAVVTSIAAEFGRPVEDVAKGLYQTLSNQIGNAADSTLSLGLAAEFSVATVTSLADSVDLVDGALNAYGLTVSSQQQVQDIFFKTIELGRVTGTELANSLGRVLTVSAQLGVSIPQVSSAMATLTIQGVKASDAATQLLNVELKLIKPTDNLKAVFAQLGVASGEMGIALFGLQGFLEKITEVGGESATEIATLFNQIRGTRGVIGLTGTAIEKANKNLKDITESAGATRKAFELINQTNAQRLTRELESARAFLVNDFGRAAVEIFNNLLASVGGAANALKVLGVVIGTLVSGGLLIFFAAAGKTALAFGNTLLTTVIPAIGKFFLELEIGTAGTVAFGLAVAAISAVAIYEVVKAFTAASDPVDKATALVEKLRQANEKNTKEAIAAAQSGNDAEVRAVESSTRTLEGFVSKKLIKIREEELAHAHLQDAIKSGLASSVEEQDKLLAKHLDKARKNIETAADAVKKITKETDDFISDLEKNQFERAQKGVPKDIEAQNRLNEAGRLEAQALTAAQAGDEKKSLDLLKEAASQVEKVAELDGHRLEGESAINELKRVGIEREFDLKRAKQDQLEEDKKLLALEQKRNEIGKAGTDLALRGKETETATKNKLDVTKDTLAAKTAADEFAVTVDGILGKLLSIEETQARVGNDQVLLEKAKKLSGQFENLRQRVLTALQAGDHTTLEDAVTRIQGTLTKLNEPGTTAGFGEDFDIKLKKVLGDLLTEIPAAETAVATLKTSLAKNEGADVAAKNLADLAKGAEDGSLTMKDLASGLDTLGKKGSGAASAINNIATAATLVPAGLSVAQGAINTFSTSNILAQVQVAISALQELANAQAGSGGGAEGLARGGLIYRAGGGWTPRGTDTIPAMLSKGEFIVNARDSKRFFSELVAINSGRTPIFRSAGGPVTNVTGDININVPDGRAPVDGRQLAMELRRQLRRRTIR